jgi:hypothetical protein
MLALALLVGCSSSSDSDGTSEPDISFTVTAPDDATTAAPTGNGSGEVDCAKIRDAAATMLVPVQLMAQVRDPSSIQDMKEPPLGPIDMDAFLGAIEDLRVLEAFPSPLGSTKDSLDFYAAAGTTLKGLLDADSVTQADVDAYNAQIGPLTDFLGKQAAISGSVGAAGC